MGTLVDTLDRYAASFLREYGHRLSDGHRHAFSAMRRCRTPHYGQLQWLCPSCEEDRSVYRSCGHRSCHRCQNHDNTRWLERQQTEVDPIDWTGMDDVGAFLHYSGERADEKETEIA